MKVLAWLSLLLVIVLVSLSAYLRLAHSGLGCAEWPECYGRIGSPPVTTQTATPGGAYRRLVESSGESLAWATPLHRLVASLLGLSVLFLFAATLARRRHRVIGAALLALTIWLALLGIRSGSLHDPAVVMGNLVGGFLMLGLLGWLVLFQGARGAAPRHVTIASGISIGILALQILLGGLTSANFAATSCRTLPDCHGSYWPGPALAQAFDLTHPHEVTALGQAVGGPERIAIHKAHRLGAVAALLAALLTAVLAWRAGSRFHKIALAVGTLAAVEFGLGAAAILSGLPIGLAVLHNWLAALLLLALLRLQVPHSSNGTE